MDRGWIEDESRMNRTWIDIVSPLVRSDLWAEIDHLGVNGKGCPGRTLKLSIFANMHQMQKRNAQLLGYTRAKSEIRLSHKSIFRTLPFNPDLVKRWSHFGGQGWRIENLLNRIEWVKCKIQLLAKSQEKKIRSETSIKLGNNFPSFREFFVPIWSRQSKISGWPRMNRGWVKDESKMKRERMRGTTRSILIFQSSNLSVSAPVFGRRGACKVYQVRPPITERDTL
jgi:hypothetical protein